MGEDIGKIFMYGYSVLLVEDEKLELDTLKAYVDWKKIGIDKVYTARGSRSALECISENEPDILITDIQMPGMSGIELARIVREEGHSCKIVFLTGYDKFEYAKEAIQIQAEDYLLKPFQVEEVEQLVQRILKKIESERHSQEAKKLADGRILEQACTGMLRDLDRAAYSYFQKGSDEVQFFLFGLYGITTQQQLFINQLPEIVHSFQLENLYIVITYSTASVKDTVNRLIMRWEQDDVRAVICDRRISLAQMHMQCLQFLQCQDDLFFGKAGMCMKPEDRTEYKSANMEAPEQAPLRNELMQAILDGDEHQAVAKLDSYLSELRGFEREICLQGAYNLYRSLKKWIDRMDADNIMSEQLIDLPKLDLLHSRSFADLEADFKEYIKHCCRLNQKGQDYYLAHWVKRYIAAHYSEDCTVEEMAEGVSLSPNYLRRKFKEATGQTILEYLTDVRLTIAGELLRNRRLKIKDVSVQSGYENVSYFTQLFSRKYGVTPNEYKKMV